jgi:hypothetical protein
MARSADPVYPLLEAAGTNKAKTLSKWDVTVVEREHDVHNTQ